MISHEQDTARMFQARFSDASVFRKAIDSIKELTSNINMNITPEGISIIAIDSSHIALTVLELKEKAFVRYKCLKPETIGLSVDNIYKIMKIANGDDSLTLSYDEEPTFLRFRFQSSKGDKITEFNVSLRIVESQDLDAPENESTCICKMPSSEYSRICKEFNSLTDSGGNLEIEANKQSLKFSIKGEIGNGSVTFMNSESRNQSENVSLIIEEPVSVAFSCRYMHLFGKASSLSKEVTMSLANEKPIVVSYSFLNGGGSLRFFLAPRISDDE